MKTDKELLELAAKAAGYGTVWGVGDPLNDDGDAFRLAVKLGNWSLIYSDDDWERCNHDGYAATRRAIVRAAAAIGESK